MSYKETIESFIYDYPILEFHYLNRKDLIFSEKVRFICEHECEHYGHSWACPPAIGSIQSCIRECEKYSRAFLFSTIAQVEDSLNFEACLKARKQHEELTLKLRERFRQEFGDVLALSTGCMQCETCAYPDSPCRHPDKRVATVESHGIMLMQTVEAMNICFNYGNDTVTYFTLLFFNA